MTSSYQSEQDELLSRVTLIDAEITRLSKYPEYNWQRAVLIAEQERLWQQICNSKQQEAKP